MGLMEVLIILNTIHKSQLSKVPAIQYTRQLYTVVRANKLPEICWELIQGMKILRHSLEQGLQLLKLRH